MHDATATVSRMTTTTGASSSVFCTIVPPHVLDKLAQAENPALSEAARRTLERDAARRTRRR